MNKHCRKLACLAMTLVMVVSLSASVFASETLNSGGFKPESDSTWGDLYRHFDPEGFNTLPIEIQEEYDSVLLDSEQPSNSVSYVSTAINEDGTTSASGYLYSEENYEETTSRSTNIAGLLGLVVTATPKTTSIGYSGVFASSIKCPRMYTSVSIYDKSTNEYIALDYSNDTNTTSCSVSGSFTGLKSKHTYTIKGYGSVTPPSGYYTSGPVTTLQNITTK